MEFVLCMVNSADSHLKIIEFVEIVVKLGIKLWKACLVTHCSSCSAIRNLEFEIHCSNNIDCVVVTCLKLFDGDLKSPEAFGGGPFY